MIAAHHTRIVITLMAIICPAGLNANDTLRIVDYPRHVSFYTKVGPTYSEIEIENPGIKDGLLFKPNPESVLGLGFSYSWFGLGVSFTLPTNTEWNKKYGKTEKFDFEAHYTLRRMMVDLTFKYYKGFYFENPESYIPNWNENTDPYPQSPNLATLTLGGSFAYIFRPDRYSSNAAYKHTQSMRRSGGSWMMGGFVSLNAMVSDTSIVPPSIRQYVDPKLDLKEVSFLNCGFSFGYSHLFTLWKKYFIGFTIFPGLSFQTASHQSSIDGKYTQINEIAVRNISRFSMGRNGDRYYWGFSTYVESAYTNHSESQIFLNSGHFEFFLGYRLDTSSWKFMKKADRLLHPRFLRFMIGDPPQRD